MPKGGWKEYFVFTRGERIAVLVLFIIMAGFIGLSFYYTPVFTSPVVDKSVQSKLTALSPKPQEKPVLVMDDAEDTTRQGSVADGYHTAPAKKEEFYFDPNTISADGLRKLGFKDKTVTNILAYRAATRFKKAEDLYNVPRIRKKSVDAVLPYVRFGIAATNAPTAAPNASAASNTTPAKPGSYKTIDVNTATATDFKAFPGVTDAVANRIVKFRFSINGFKSVDDVAKTYGLRDSTFNFMRPFLTISQK